MMNDLEQFAIFARGASIYYICIYYGHLSCTVCGNTRYFLVSYAAKAQEQLQSTVGKIGTNSAMAAFERMEEKVLLQEARAQSAQELVGADLESQFAQLEAGSDVDDELAALKAQMSLGPATSPNQPSLPQASQSSSAKSNEVVDSELEQLRKQLDQL